MSEFTRRSAISAALLTAAAINESTDAAPVDEKDLTKDQQRVIAAGLTEQEADCWQKITDAAAAFFQLKELHPLDKQEVASAIHIVQNKLLGRPAYRKYLGLAKQSQRQDEGK